MSVLPNHFVNPNPDTIGNNAYEFLAFLGGPASIFLTGKDTRRCRAFITLLHGNEPSGTIALHRWLKSGLKPSVNIICIVASVEAANKKPEFSHRVLSPHRDLNRCFKQPFTDPQGQLAHTILQTIREYHPEAAIDMHNTSGSGPAFAVATHNDQQHDALTSLFTQRLIITHLRLGALMEISEYLCPTVTIECGGRLDDEAHETAWEGLSRFFTKENVLSNGDSDWGLEKLNNPVRLELKDDCEVIYATEPSDEATLILDPGIEHLNSGVTPKGTFLGWANTQDISDIFASTNSQNRCVVNQLITIEDGKLITEQDLKLFMVTSNPEIAKMDCLFYAVNSDGAEV